MRSITGSAWAGRSRAGVSTDAADAALSSIAHNGSAAAKAWQVDRRTATKYPRCIPRAPAIGVMIAQLGTTLGPAVARRRECAFCVIIEAVSARFSGLNFWRHICSSLRRLRKSHAFQELPSQSVCGKKRPKQNSSAIRMSACSQVLCERARSGGAQLSSHLDKFRYAPCFSEVTIAQQWAYVTEVDRGHFQPFLYLSTLWCKGHRNPRFP